MQPGSDAPASEPKVLHAVPAPRLRVVQSGRALLLLITGLVSVFALHAARDFLLPVVLALLLAGVFAPLMQRLERRGAPRTVAAGLIVLATVGLLLLGVYYLSGPASTWLAKTPAAFARLEQALHDVQRPLQNLTHTAAQLRRLVHGNDSPPLVNQEGAPLLDLLVTTEQAAVTIGLTLILLYFLLASGDFFKRGLLGFFEDERAKARVAECAHDIQRQISVYLGAVTSINFCLGSAVSFVLWLLGMPNPVLWGVMFGALTYVPYLGPLVGLGVITAVALVSLEDVVTALTAPLACLGLSAIEGHLVTPVVLGRSLALNPVVIFVDLMFWTWLWGFPGAIMAVPVLMVFKIVCDHVEPLAAVGRVLGRYDSVAERHG
jgi:predicted PurR-regulated permease PerM